MKATELIKTLQDLVAAHGDLPVYRGDTEGESEAVRIIHHEGPRYTGDIDEPAIVIW